MSFNFQFSIFNFQFRAKRAGFTLVEMIVSLALFSVVAVIAIGALLKVIDANDKAQSIQSSVTNINFAMESMSRDLRTGTDYLCGIGVYMPSSLSTVSPCKISSGNSYIAFNSSRTAPNGPNTSCNLITVYAFVNIPDAAGQNQIHLQKAEQKSCNQSPDSTSYYLSDLISPTDMTITSHELGVLYNSPSSYPLTFIRITGNAGERAKDQTFVDLETAVSARSRQ
jgi:prepilin-type N-terminal cleavage/methylation domain-containing protein